MIGDSRKRRGGGVTSRKNDDVEGGLDFFQRHFLKILVIFDQGRHEVGPLCLEVHAAMNLFKCKCVMVFLFFQETFGYQFPTDEFEGRVISNHGDDDHGLNIIENYRHPWMIFTIFEAVERLAKSKISYDIKSCEAEPIRHVGDSAFRASRDGDLLKSCHQHRHIRLNDCLLRFQSFVSESILHQLSHSCMISNICCAGQSRILLAIR